MNKKIEKKFSVLILLFFLAISLNLMPGCSGKKEEAPKTSSPSSVKLNSVDKTEISSAKSIGQNDPKKNETSQISETSFLESLNNEGLDPGSMTQDELIKEFEKKYPPPPPVQGVDVQPIFSGAITMKEIMVIDAQRKAMGLDKDDEKKVVHEPLPTDGGENLKLTELGTALSQAVDASPKKDKSLSTRAINNPSEESQLETPLTPVVGKIIEVGNAGQPPDTHGAVGPNHVVTVMNFSIAIHDKAGAKIGNAVALSAFFSGLGFAPANDFFDPRAIYDPLGQRFIIACSANRRSASSGVALAVSATDDPTGTWYRIAIDGDAANTNWVDFPHIGVNKNWVVVTANLYTNQFGDQYRGVNVWAWKKTDLYAATPNPQSNKLIELIGHQGGTLAPSISYDPNLDTLFFLSPGNNGSGLLYVYTLKPNPSVDNPTFATSTRMPVIDPWIRKQPAKQFGSASTITTNDDRFSTECTVRNNRLWCVHTASLPVVGTRDRAVAQWVEVDVNPASANYSKTVQHGLLDDYDPDPGHSDPNKADWFYYYPSIAVNKNNEALIGFSCSSSEHYVSACYAHRDPSMPLGKFRDVQVYSAGTNVTGDSRWGDYSATRVDPIDDTTFWTVQEIAPRALRWGKITTGEGDTVLPSLTNAVSINATRVRLTFSEPMPLTPAIMNPANYSFTGGLTASLVNYETPSTILLTVSAMTLGSNYTVTVNPLVVDAADNPMNPAANSRSFAGLGLGPAITLSSPAANLINYQPIFVAINFSSIPVDFDLGDINTTAASASNLQGTGTQYSFNLAPTLGDGVFSCSILDGVIHDSGGNPNTASNVISRTYDVTRPVAAFISSVTSPTNLSTIPVTVSFAENVTGFASADMVIANATISGFTAVSGSLYTFNLLNPTAQGPVTVTLGANKLIDSANNGNVAGSFSITYDTVAPTVAITTTATSPTTTSPIPVTVTFSEPVTNFDVGDLTLVGGSAENFTLVSSAVYTFNFVPSQAGLLSVSVAANKVQDLAGNNNTVSNTLQVQFEGSAMGMTKTTLSSSSGNFTSVSPIPVTVSFTNPVTGFTTEDVVTTGDLESFSISGSGDTYSFSLTPRSVGPLSVFVPGNVALDSSGNSNTPSNTLGIVYDNAPPKVSITSPAADPTNLTSMPVTVNFSKPVTGFLESALSLTNASIVPNSFTVLNPTTYTFMLSPQSPGLVEVSVASGVALDDKGQGNTSSEFVRTYQTNNQNI